MFYIYKFDHLGHYKIVWRQVHRSTGYETDQQANQAIRYYAQKSQGDIINFRSFWFAEPKDVEPFVSTAYYNAEDKAELRRIYGCR